MKSIRMLDDGPVGVGTRCEADVRIFGVAVTDPVTITEFEPPHRYAISHDGTFNGRGLITLESGADGTTTIVRWDEVLVPPVFAHLGALVMTPVTRGDLPGGPGPLQGARRDGFRHRLTANRAAPPGRRDLRAVPCPLRAPAAGPRARWDPAVRACPACATSCSTCCARRARPTSAAPRTG